MIAEENSGAALRFELPEISRSGVDVSVRPGAVLIVSGVGSRGAFRREMVLPGWLDETKARAAMSGGLLWVTAPATGGVAETDSVRLLVGQA